VHNWTSSVCIECWLCFDSNLTNAFAFTSTNASALRTWPGHPEDIESMEHTNIHTHTHTHRRTCTNPYEHNRNAEGLSFRCRENDGGRHFRLKKRSGRHRDANHTYTHASIHRSLFLAGRTEEHLENLLTMDSHEHTSTCTCAHVGAWMHARRMSHHEYSLLCETNTLTVRNQKLKNRKHGKPKVIC
jgi:hypothetical protein